MKKSKIIGFNFANANPQPSVYLHGYQAPAHKGKILRKSKDEKLLILAECENAGNYSNCDLRVLGDLGPNSAKQSFKIKLDGSLKEFDVLEEDMVIALTNDNRIQIFKIDGTMHEQVTDLGSILPVNSPSKLCNL